MRIEGQRGGISRLYSVKFKEMVEMFGSKAISEHESKIPCCAVMDESKRQFVDRPIMSMEDQRVLFKGSPASALRVLTTNVSNIDLAIDTTWAALKKQTEIKETLTEEEDKNWVDMKVEYFHKLIFDLIALRDFLLENRCL